MPAETEAALEQPNGTFLFRKDSASGTVAASAFVSPITVEDLLAKMISATGGEPTLHRHRTLAIRSRAYLENQGLVADIQTIAQYPNRRQQTVTLTALGTKVVGRTRDYFDGMSGRFESDFTPASEYAGNALFDTGIQSFMRPVLDARKIFPTITIVGQKTVNGEDVLVLKKKPALGSPVTEYVSLKTFQVRRREFMVGANPSEGAPSSAYSETYSDYRAVDGEMLPFKTVTQSASLGTQVETVIEAAFNVPVPADAFTPGKETARFATK
jgi:hypothetical protein